MLYGSKFVSLSVASVQLKVGDQIQKASISPTAVAKVFTLPLSEGPVRLETVMLDEVGEPLAEAYYVYIRPEDKD